MLGNLVENAAKYGGGSVFVTVEPRPAWSISSSRTTAKASPRPSASASSIAACGSTAASPAPGLGLAIVRDVAEIYGGTVELEESEDLGGLLVRLRLPLAPEPALVPETAAPAVIAPIIDLPKTEFAEEGPASTASGPSKTGGAGSGTGGSGTGTGSQSGSGGTIIYRAEWQKLNSPAELNRNMPRNIPSGIGWGEIVCRASPKFRVTDCKFWGESPKGSGYGQAVLSIADVFRVKAPIVDGKPQLGAWVLIHIGYYNSRPPLY
jgi:hypothetical protein